MLTCIYSIDDIHGYFHITPEHNFDSDLIPSHCCLVHVDECLCEHEVVGYFVPFFSHGEVDEDDNSVGNGDQCGNARVYGVGNVRKWDLRIGGVL